MRARSKAPQRRRQDIMQLDKLKTTAGLDVAGKRVLVRADLNVPVAEGRVTDATRLTRLVPGILDLADRGAKVIVLSHFGRPKGARVPEMSLKPVAEALGKALGRPVAFADDCIGDTAAKAVAGLANGGFLLAYVPLAQRFVLVVSLGAALLSWSAAMSKEAGTCRSKVLRSITASPSSTAPRL